MRTVVRGGLLVAACLVALGADCCDPKHDAYTENAKVVGECRGHGGIPIVNAITDDGGHAFVVLDRCEFPCDKRLAVEQ